MTGSEARQIALERALAEYEELLASWDSDNCDDWLDELAVYEKP